MLHYFSDVNNHFQWLVIIWCETCFISGIQSSMTKHLRHVTAVWEGDFDPKSLNTIFTLKSCGMISTFKTPSRQKPTKWLTWLPRRQRLVDVLIFKVLIARIASSLENYPNLERKRRSCYFEVWMAETSRVFGASWRNFQVYQSNEYDPGFTRRYSWYTTRTWKYVSHQIRQLYKGKGLYFNICSTEYQIPYTFQKEPPCHD